MASYRRPMDDAGGGRRGLRPTITSELAHAVTETWGFSLDSARDLGGSTGLNLRVETVHGPFCRPSSEIGGRPVSVMVPSTVEVGVPFASATFCVSTSLIFPASGVLQVNAPGSPW